MRWLLVGVGLIALGPLPPAWDHWRYARPLEPPATETPQLAKVTLPLEVYGQAQASLADLRLIDDTGQEVPYILHWRRGKEERRWLEAKLGEVSLVPGQYTQALVDLGPQTPAHNSLQLETDERDFFRRVELAVSDDGRQWRILQQQVPIYRFEKERLSGNQTLSYSETSARYLRLRISDGGQLFSVQGVRVAHEVSEEPELVALPARFVSKPDAPAGKSWWQVDFGSKGVPVSEVRFAVPEGQFHRPVEVLASDDGEQWSRVATGEIYRLASGVGTRSAATPSSANSLRTSFEEARGRYWLIVVLNRNDAPLENVSLELWGTPRHLIFRQQPRRSYQLIYGNEGAHAPQYELARLTDPKEFDAAVAGSVGGEQVNTAYADPRAWSERHPEVLWAVLGVTVAVLLVLALRSLRQPA